MRVERDPVKAANTEGLRFSADEFIANAMPIAWTDAFRRLRDVTFLGILSRTFGDVENHPLGRRGQKDQTRAHHSLKVSLLTSRITFELGLSADARKYAVAWGMLHDIATWPLSHTGEAAFSDATDTSAHELRRAMIVGDESVGSFSVAVALRELNIDADVLLSLFDKDFSGPNDDLSILHQIVHSPLTPDTLEGMHRSGRVLGIDIPRPDAFIRAWERDLVSVMLKEECSHLAFRFWRGKSKVYSKFINSDETVEFESAWSKSIRDCYVGTSLIDSLNLSEKDIVDRSSDRGVERTDNIVRYKAPLKYGVAPAYKNKRVLKESMPVDDLSGVFIKVRP